MTSATLSPPAVSGRWSPRPLQPDDWQSLESLTDLAQLPTDRVAGLRRLAQDRPAPEASQLTLLAGSPGNGLERLLGHLTDADTAEALMQEAQGVLVIGPEPHTIQPSLGHWSERRRSLKASEHVLAVRGAEPPSSGLEAQLASLGGCTQLLFVTRLGQPLHQGERRLLAALSRHAAAVRVVVSAVPGEDVAADEAAEVIAFVERHLQRLGIDAVRRLGTVLWWSDGRDGGVGALADVHTLLDVPVDVVRGARRAGFHDALRRLLDDLETRLPEDTPAVELAPDERQRLADELRSFLEDLGRHLETRLAQDSLTEERLRRLLVQRVESWTAHTSVEGHWLRYLDRVRPGSEGALLALVEEQAVHLRVLPHDAAPAADEVTMSSNSVPSSQTEAPAAGGWFLATQRAALAFIGGFVGYFALVRLLETWPGPFSDNPTTGLVLGILAFVLTAALTFGLSQRWFKPKGTGSRVLPAAPRRASPPRLVGWSDFHDACIAWFSQCINAPTDAPRQRLANLRRGLTQETAP